MLIMGSLENNEQEFASESVSECVLLRCLKFNSFAYLMTTILNDVNATSVCVGLESI